MGSGDLKISFYGAAGEVTGSRHLIEAEDRRILLDCGMFQGHRQASLDKNKSFPFHPQELDAVVLSHAHIDHSGCLPLLVKKGSEAPIHCTQATKELCVIMLLDSARLQEADARFFNKIHAEDGQSITPLYSEEDAKHCLSHLAPADFEKSFSLEGAADVQFSNAGHVLGSAMVQLDFTARGGRRRVLYTGDLGRRKSLLMDPPDAPRDVDYLVIESTYGSRTHHDASQAEETLAGVVRRAVAEKGRVLIPSFALERTQEIVFLLQRLLRAGAVPRIPVFVDSPMASAVTKIFDRNVGSLSFDPAFQRYAEKVGDPFGLEDIRYVETKEESQSLNDRPGPLIILSASGMCEGGRILHHLRHGIDKDSTTILIVGHQAEGTLGRRIQDGAKKVKIFGLEHEVWARVETMHFFSSHADKDDLFAFVTAVKPKPRKVFLVHGDNDQRAGLAQALAAAGVTDTVCPEFGQGFDLD